MKVALITYGFPERSETFILDKAERLGDHNALESHVFYRTKGSLRTTKLSSIRSSKLISAHDSRMTVILQIMYYLIVDGLSFIKFFRSTSAGLTKTVNLYTIFRYSPDIVHFEWTSLIPFYKEIFEWSTQVIVSSRGADIEYLPVLNTDLITTYEEFLPKASVVHTLGGWLKSILIERYGVQENAITIIPPARKLEEYYCNTNNNSSCNSRFTLITVSRLHWKKGHIDLIRAISQIINDGFDVECWILGEGEMKEQIMFEIFDLGLQEHVFLKGWQSRQGVREYLSSADLFVLPSVSEGFGNSVIEAMACRTPVLVSNVGCADAVNEWDTGLIFERRNLTDLKNKITWAMQNSHGLKEITESAYSNIQRSNRLDGQIESFVRLYEDVMHYNRPKK